MGMHALHCLQEEGGHAWTYSQGELAALLASGRPLPQDIQQVVDVRCVRGAALCSRRHKWRTQRSALLFGKMACHGSMQGSCAKPACMGAPWADRHSTAEMRHRVCCRKRAGELRACMVAGDEQAAVGVIDAARKAAWIKHEKTGSYPIHEAIQLVSCHQPSPLLQAQIDCAMRTRIGRQRCMLHVSPAILCPRCNAGQLFS
jgi:hypothetical protein